MTSISFITWAGLKKWIPITRSGRRVAMESSVTERAEVLVARIVAAGQAASSSAKTFFLTVMSSVTASITRSTSANAS